MSYVFERLADRRDGREAGADAGFTLIELMVVLLIMAILLAIAIPTFLGVSSSANDRAAQSNLNTALTNAKSYYDGTGQQSYGTDGGTAIQAALTTQEPSVKWVVAPTNSTGSGVISLNAYDATNGGGIVLAAYSAPTQECWYVVDNTVAEAGGPTGAQGAGTYYGVAKNPAGGCNATIANIPNGAVFQGGSSGKQGFPPAA